MKNLNQIITTVLVILFFGCIFYTYTPIKKAEQPENIINNNTGLWGSLGIDLSNLETSRDVTISSQDNLDLITDMMLAYNNMNTTKVISFFADSCDIIDLNGKEHMITHKDFETFFNSMDSIKWIPSAIVPLKLTEYRTNILMRTAVIVHSAELRYKKDGSVWHKELLEVFYIENEKIVWIDQYGRDREHLLNEIEFLLSDN